jgi:predicted dehydrogenase
MFPKIEIKTKTVLGFCIIIVIGTYYKNLFLGVWIVMEKLRMGVLGCSRHYALRLSEPLKNARFVLPYAVASREEEKAEAFARKCAFPKFYGSYEKLLTDPDVDFIYIPLANFMHKEYIMKSASAGKSVLCEKPICLSAEEVKEASEHCKKKNVILMEAFMYRFHPQWLRVKEIVSSGEIGEVMAVHAHYSYMNKDENNIRNKAELGGGALYDIGCYTVSCARYLFGREPLRVVSTLERDPTFKTDILFNAMLDFGRGRSATFSCATQAFPCQSVSIVGTSGIISMELPFNMYGDVKAKFEVTTSLGKRVVETEIANQYVLQFDSFATSVVLKKPAPIDISDSISNMTVIDALFKSAHRKAWVEL